MVKISKNPSEIFVASSDQNNPSVSDVESSIKAADFEKAISATGFGKFNILVILIAIPSGWCSIFETTTMSYVFPAAQCDLKLSLENKGLLNAITYTGMISSAFVWGFLCDTLGRKKLLITGFLLDAIFVIMSGFSQTVTVLMVSKFFGGFIINGPFAALTTYLSEVHCARYRARVLMALGVIYSIGNVLLPLFALAILPLGLEVVLVKDAFKLHSWNFFLFICAFAPLTSFVSFMFLPESPKFLMTMGRNDEALKIFQKIYTLNTGKPSGSYPIKNLVDEIALDPSSHRVTANRSKIQAMKEGWRQIAPLFVPPHLSKIILVCLLQMLFMMSLNSLRLWLPQIFQAINDYKHYNNGTGASLCAMLDVIRPAKNVSSTSSYVNSTICIVNTNNSAVYINSMIVAFVNIMVYFFTGALINKVGKKKILNFLGLVGGISAMLIYFAHNSTVTTALAAIFVAFASISVTVLLSVVVDLFPTTLRTMTVSLTMMVGRSGAMLGNLVFPILLQTGCAPPFFTVGSVIIFCALLSCLLPNTDLKALR